MLPSRAMRGRPSSGISGGVGLLFLLILAACNSGSHKKADRRATLWHKDKIPYGTYVAYYNLKYIFPNARVTINKSSPADYNEFHTVSERKEGSNSDALQAPRRKKAYIIIAQRVVPDESEINAIMNFVGAGNHVFISAFHFGDSLLSLLHLKPHSRQSSLNNRDSLQLSVYDPVNGDSSSFVYPGASADTYVSSLDSQYATILGRDAKGRPDFVRFTYKGGGSLYLQFAPLAFSNFFLLHKDNKAYYDNVFSYLPASVEEVKWDAYFRYGRTRDFSALQFILSQRSLRWAFWLLLLLFALIYLFESKRRQKMIPVIGRLQNTSLDFVKTIGRLYFQRRDNHNLSLKMIAHFQDHVRSRYNLQSSVLDEEFTDRLSYKSGVDRQQVNEVVSAVRAVQESTAVTDEELLAFNKKMEEFYKKV